MIVTSHSGGGRSGLRFWPEPFGESYVGMMRPEADADPYLGRPVTGRDATGRPFVAYVAEDDVEVVRWTGSPQRLRLPMPFVAHDVAGLGDTIVVAGGGGHAVFTAP
jgi:hypothetical protein